MIVKNERDFLNACLKSVVDLIGLTDLVVVDTGSTDGTRQIAVEFGARVFDFKWIDDFSAARNFAAEQAQNDWVLCVDADEEVVEIDKDVIRKFINDPKKVGSVERIDTANMSTFFFNRLYSRRLYRFEGTIHEQIKPLDEAGAPVVSYEIPILLNHYGYTDEAVKKNDKISRNERMLEDALNKAPDDPYLLFQMGKIFFNRQRDLPKACGFFEKSLALHPRAETEYVYSLVECYGYALINTGRYREAHELVERYKPSYWRYPHFRFLAGHVRQNAGMLIEAVECFESCIGDKEWGYKGITSFLSYFNIGVILEAVGMKNDAVEMYKKAGDYPPALERLKSLF